MAERYPTVLGEGVLGVTKVALYTVPARTRTRVESITLVTNDSVDRVVNVWLNLGRGSRRIAPKNLTLRANHLIEMDAGYTLQPGNSIEAQADAEGMVDYTVSGEEMR